MVGLRRENEWGGNISLIFYAGIFFVLDCDNNFLLAVYVVITLYYVYDYHNLWLYVRKENGEYLY